MFFKKRNKKIGKTLTGKANYRTTRTKGLFKPKAELYRIKQKKTGKKFTFLKKIFSIFIILGISGYAVYILGFSDFFIINNIKYKLEGTELEEADLNPYLNSMLAKFIINLNSTVYENLLKNSFPQIQTVQIKKIFPKTVEVYVKTYPLKANIINKHENLEKKILINEGGYLISKDIENPNLPYIIVYSEKELELKTKLMTEERLNQILLSIQSFQDYFNIKIFDALYLQKQREVHLRTNKFFYVWIDLQQDIETQLKKLKIALPKLNIHQENLEYIDLRIANKIFYKRR